MTGVSNSLVTTKQVTNCFIINVHEGVAYTQENLSA